MFKPKNFTDTVTMSDNLNMILLDKSGKTKAIRDVSDIHELAVNFDKKSDVVKEKFTLKQKNKQSNNNQEKEIIVVNRFLPVFNKENNTQFILSQNQPLTDSHIDILISDGSKEIELQVRVSDDEPWGKLFKNKFFERSGKGFEISHNAIKRAIETKIKKYPLQIRNDLILLLDGWLAVRPEDLENFITTENEFMKNSEFKEIWFVGEIQKTIIKLYPY
ncbi:hypothetical protein KKE19_04105 [Patescibacteria group bacterium]|nr:hypothetical protein [Patescibacteria group bacterium]MBU4578667.1 hypothetical protein [Patescibacteria group bacterium]MCG2701801.1 hypothetical protein [Candidatus Parcubacteria bacterium]